MSPQQAEAASDHDSPIRLHGQVPDLPIGAWIEGRVHAPVHLEAGQVEAHRFARNGEAATEDDSAVRLDGAGIDRTAGPGSKAVIGGLTECEVRRRDHERHHQYGTRGTTMRGHGK
jgi:hypothetical protein